MPTQTLYLSYILAEAMNLAVHRPLLCTVAFLGNLDFGHLRMALERTPARLGQSGLCIVVGGERGLVVIIARQKRSGKGGLRRSILPG